MVPSNPLMMMTNMNRLSPALYHLLTVSNDNICVNFLLFDHSNFVNFYFQIISFPIDAFGHWKVSSYQSGYAVQDEEGSYAIVILFTPPWSIKKKQWFWLFLLVICMVKFLFNFFLGGVLTAFQSSTQNKNKK